MFNRLAVRRRMVRGAHLMEYPVLPRNDSAVNCVPWTLTNTEGIPNRSEISRHIFSVLSAMMELQTRISGPFFVWIDHYEKVAA